jgi:hypothetical protein
MGQNLLHFDVTDLNVTVEEGVKFKWQGKEIESGPLSIKLGAPGSAGVINYDTGNVDVEYRARITSPALEEVYDILEDMGEERGETAPFDVIIRSKGSIFGDDHSLRLSGKGEIADHRLFNPAETSLEILAPTH